MKQTIVLLIMCLPLLINAQDDKARPDDKVGLGIKFEQGLTWQQIKAKAKKENKYIFVDCYTTWCGSCKLMDKEVYPNEELGNYINAHFISVKSQMDKSAKDNEQVKTWYGDAAVIEKEYGIPAYPTYLFFSPKGKLVNRDVGYKNANDFLAIANKAKAPGTVPPYQRYFTLVKEYQQGHKNYAVMPYLIDTARLLGQRELVDSLGYEYINYLLKAPEEKWYTKPNITFVASFIKGSKTKLFKLFYPDGTKADDIMNENGFAQRVVDRIINTEDIIPFAKLATGMKSTAAVKSVPEPEWQQLITSIANKYPGNYAERLVLAARVNWYSDQKDWANCAKWFALFIQKFPVVDADEEYQLFINEIAWDAVFQRSTCKEEIDASIMIMEKLLESVTKMKGPLYGYGYVDTYANLLYKADRINDAIKWEEKAWKMAVEMKTSQQDVEIYAVTLEKMKKDEPTWPHYISINEF